MTFQNWVDEENVIFGLALSLRNVPSGISYRPEIRKEIWDRLGTKVKAVLDEDGKYFTTVTWGSRKCLVANPQPIGETIRTKTGVERKR